MELENTNTVGEPAEKIQLHVFACHELIHALKAQLAKAQEERDVAIQTRNDTTSALRRESERLDWLDNWGYEYDGMLEKGWGIGLPLNQKRNVRDIRAAIDAQMFPKATEAEVLANAKMSHAEERK
jgi:hypothetical protein